MPSPTSISYWWNFGSLLSLCLSIQLITGIFLAIFYSRRISLSFLRVVYIIQDVNYGWFFRVVHANGASAFFVCLYLHIARGFYYGRYCYFPTWGVGSLIFLVTIATAFLGYVLPWGQISFWGASVITNLFSAIPYFGGEFVIWLWGGLSVDRATLRRFFSLHFFIPFVISALVAVHLVFLHETGSNNPLGLNSNLDKIYLSSLFLVKDFFGGSFFLILFFYLVCFYPWLLGDPENFINANPLVTPVHIQPEWYFLFAYAILRAIPRKLGGVAALAASVVILFFVPLMFPQTPRRIKFVGPLKTLFWLFVVVVILLTWIGARPVEYPFITIGQELTIIYFMFYFLFSFIKKLFFIISNKSVHI